MTNYTKTTDFAAKDSLPSGDSGKIIRGSEFETEFDNIATAVNSKSDANNPTFTGTVTIDGLTVNGNTILGNAATDTVTVTADIASNLIPSADDTYNLGAVGAEWNDLHVDGVAYIDTIDGFATTGDVNFGDNDKAIFGAGSDLQIYHDGSDSFIVDQGTGNLAIRASSSLYLQSAAGSTYFQGVSGGASTLYNAGSAKLATTSTGIDITGVITTDGMTTSADINFGDNDKAVFGAGSDLQIYHSGSHSYITDSGTGNLYINGSGLVWIGSSDLQESYAVFNDDGAVQLKYDNTTKLATTSTGIDVTGTVTADGLSVNSGATNQGAYFVSTDTGQTIALSDSASSNLLITDSNGLNILTNGDANSAGTNATRAARFKPNKDVEFYEDTGTTAKFFWDASAESLGIGTDSPDAVLTVSTSSSSDVLKLTSSASTTPLKLLFEKSASEQGIIEYNRNGDLELYNTDTDGGVLISGSASADPDLYVAHSGRVGIGTDSPGTKQVSIVGSQSYGQLRLAQNETDNADQRMAITFRQYDFDEQGFVGMLGFTNSAGNQIVIGGGTGDFNCATAIRFATANDGITTQGIDRARITNGGHFLVGKTVQDQTNIVGFEAKDDGLIAVTTDGGIAGLFNRKTSDGSIVEFRQNNTTVGTISAASTNVIYGNDTRGIKIEDSLIIPRDIDDTPADAVMDLGSQFSRFANLYLSGGVVFGSTGGNVSSKTLDDYEEGTWTPVAQNYEGTMTVNSATYTKIGNTVTIRCDVSFDSTSDGSGINMVGLPFNHTGTNKGNGGFCTKDTSGTTEYVTGEGSASILLYNDSYGSVTYTDVASGSVAFVYIYETTS